MSRRAAAVIVGLLFLAVPVPLARATQITFAGDNQVGTPATISSSGGSAQITVATTGSAGVVTVSSTDTLTVQPKNPANPVPTECTVPAGNQSTCSSVPNFFLSLTGPNVFNASGVPIAFIMTGPASAALTITGGDASNVLQGSPTGDTLTGGQGTDTFIPGAGADTVSGSGGRDSAGYTDSAHTAGGVTVAQAGASLSVIGKDGTDGAGDALSGIEELALSRGPDSGEVATPGITIKASDGDDDLTVTGADASLSGDAGNDTLTGGAGSQTLDGGDGNDTITGGDGADTLKGGPGDDLIQARDGVADQIDCGDGVDSGNADDGDTLVGCENVATPSSEQAAANPPSPPPPGGSPPPPVVPALSHVAVKFSARWVVARDKRTTAVRMLRLTNVPAGAHIEVKCSSKRTGCPFSRKSITSKAGGSVHLEALFVRRIQKRKVRAPLRPGTIVAVKVTAPQQLGRRVSYKLRRGKTPKPSETCLDAKGAAEAC